MPNYVTHEELVELVGASASSSRVTLAVGAANSLIPVWVRQGDGTDETPPTDPPEDDFIVRTAALELAHELYRAHVAVGGVFAVEDLLARMPADRVRPIRDLLDARTHAWGIG